MVGRAGVLARLTGLVAAAEVGAGDQPAVALVSGEAGLGKTRLVRELATAVGDGVRVLTVQAQPGSIGRAGEVIAQLAPPGASDAAEAALAAVGAAAALGPTVLVVEDLHWADIDSVNALDRIAQQPWSSLVIVGTYRPGDLFRGSPGGDLVLRLERRHAVEQIRLEHLDRSEVGALLAAIDGGIPSSGAVEAVHRRSGGNPFVVEELIRCCGPTACTDDVLSAQLPWSLQDAVQQQLGSFTPGERRLAEAMAVYGRPAPFAVLADVADVDEGALSGELQALTRRGVVVEESEDKFWLTHALVADAVDRQLIGRERRRLHQRCFEAERRLAEPDHAALAHHALGAGRFDEVPAIAREGAPRYLARGASFQALRLAGAALAETPDDPLLLGVATEAAWRLDFRDEAQEHGRRWAEVATGMARVDALRFLARAELELDHDVESREALDELVELAENEGDPLRRARAEASVAQILMLSYRAEEAITWAERALADAERCGDALTAAQAMVERGSALIDAAPRDEAKAALLAAADAAREVDDPVLLARVLNNLAELVAPNTEERRAFRREMRAAVARAGFDKLGEPVARLWDTQAAFWEGDLPAYRRSFDEGMQWWAGRQQKFAATARIDLALEEGRLDDARASLAEGIARHLPGSSSERLRQQLVLAALRGDRDGAESAFADLGDSPTLPDTVFVPTFGLGVVEAALAAGIDTARIRRELLDGFFRDHPSVALLRAHADGLLLLADGEHARAVQAFTSVLDEPDLHLARPLAGSLRTALAQAHLALGDRAGALAAAQEAEQDLARWPGWRRDRAQALLRRVQGASARGDGELTPREREVAALIAEGLTNGQLADRLFISPKTAAVHVSNILAKLGLSGRAEVAAWTVRHGVALEPSS